MVSVDVVRMAVVRAFVVACGGGECCCDANASACCGGLCDGACDSGESSCGECV